MADKMDDETPPTAPSGGSSESKPTSPAADQSATTHPHSKLPPCDQCRKRKVKCQQTNDGPCDRCIQSALTCTRDIQRKKRGPKKGSGSVIAKLRGEGEQLRAQEALPPFNLTPLEMQLPGLRTRAYTNDSIESSPIGSPIGSQYSDYGPPADLMNVPRSVPLGFGDEISPLGNGGFSHGGVQFPSAWQVTEDQPLLSYPSPSSANGYVSVNDLAHQIFQDPSLGQESQMYSQTGLMGANMNRPTSIDALITGSRAPTNAPSETGTNASSPRPMYGPKYLYRSDSSPPQAEPRLTALASEIGVSAQLLSQCIKQWFRHIYPIQPVLHEPTFMSLLNQAEELSTQDKILILSLCAVTVTHAAPPSDLTLQNKQDFGKELINQCLLLRHTYDWIENATLTTVISSFFICITYFELKQVRSHHFFLREAIGFAREMNVDTERTKDGPVESICRRRMLGLLFITERGCAILRNKPISITRMPTLPRDFFDAHDEVVLAGFSSLCSLFSVLDEKFVQLWYANDLDEDSESTPFENVAGIQHELNKLSFENIKMTSTQKADILITHQWLRLIFWQASMRQGLISSNATDQIFCYDYPILIARDLCRVLRTLDPNLLTHHGQGIFEKCFECAYTLMDTLTLTKRDWATSDDLRYLFSCLSASPNSHNTYVKVLENKINLESAAQSPISQTG